MGLFGSVCSDVLVVVMRVCSYFNRRYASHPSRPPFGEGRSGASVSPYGFAQGRLFGEVEKKQPPPLSEQFAPASVVVDVGGDEFRDVDVVGVDRQGLLDDSGCIGMGFVVVEQVDSLGFLHRFLEMIKH